MRFSKHALTKNAGLESVAAVTAILASVSALHAGGPSFPNLGFVSPNAVSADGLVVVGRNNFGGSEAFRWTAAEGLVGLGDLPGGTVFSEALAVSADGSVIVGRSVSDSGSEAFRWTQATGMVGLGDLSGGIFFSQASGVSADGSVVVGWSTSGSGTEAFRWQTGVMVGLGDLPGGSFWSEAHGVSASGSVIVGRATSASGTEAFRWRLGHMKGLDDLPGGSFASNAFGLSATIGSYVVGGSSSGAGSEAFRWTSTNGMVGLGDLPGGYFAAINSTALAVSADGSVVVGRGETGDTNDPQDAAFIWDATNEIRNLKSVLIDDFGLNINNWRLTRATGISDDGLTIVGYGLDLSSIRGWVATLGGPVVPEDVNGDGVVDVLDLIIVLDCFGMPAVPDCGAPDINGDGTVNVLDLIALLLQFGAGG